MIKDPVHPGDVVRQLEETKAELAANDKERSQPIDVVIHATGLTHGRGAFRCLTMGELYSALTELLIKKAFGEAGSRIVIEP